MMTAGIMIKIILLIVWEEENNPVEKMKLIDSYIALINA
jgi:hypothetical protein